MFTDGTTEPIIAIIGHPIAGNPSQLAIERSLHALGLEWRVLSFDVTPENVAKALDGFSVTGIAGVMIATNLQDAAAKWYSGYAQATQPTDDALQPPADAQPETRPETRPASDQPVDPPSTQSSVSRINCLYRDEQLGFVGSDQQIAYLETRLAKHPISDALWLGELPSEEQRACWPSHWNLFSDSPASTVPVADVDADLVASADLIVLADMNSADPDEDDFDEWPADDGTTFVIDLVGSESVVEQLRQRGYIVVGCVDLQVGMLAGCIEKWTQRQASHETIAEAIEEYFGV
ncbi:hypothetical protein LF1_13940 [Rubripirellula obstinata]|uniref:Shikimate dehydrogenase n=1 Tax=Rubripirellula obstinata TaxID=406547 RepID=A0A5B1CH17_9BACT|nr:hypothetical protein [Rubripirellula obstinata]KAA1258870.1 hypothetical protein LF1_13940 [Rubripirellula obstinata]